MANNPSRTRRFTVSSRLGGNDETVVGVVATNITGRCFREYRNKMICDMIRIKGGPSASALGIARGAIENYSLGKRETPVPQSISNPKSPSCTLDGDNGYDVLCEYPSFSLAVSYYLGAQKEN